MTLSRIAAALALAGLPLLGALPAAAQTVRNAETPAELPPPGFDGREYVDSRGCMYIRAGVDGNVTWVPRMTRDRQVVCGQTPTEQKPALAAAPQQDTQPAPVAVAEPAPVAAPAAAAPAASTPAPVATLRPAPRPTSNVGAPMPTVASAPVQPAAKPRPAATRVVAAPVRSAPAPVAQAAPKQQVVRVAPAPQLQRVASNQAFGRYIDRSQVPPNARIVPRHVYENLQKSTTGIYVPKGYEPVWDDGRLNTKRAVQTLQGRDSMLLVWTNTSPRRLIDRRSGRDVTAKFPKLIYPYTSMEAQRMARVSTKSAVAPKRQTAPKTAAVTTRATPKATGATRYVQVGVFAQEGNARAAAAKLQRYGLPVNFAVNTRKGQTLRTVLVPVRTQSDLNAALSAARRAGFADAFLR